MDRAVYERMEEIDGRHWWFVARRKIVEALMATHIKTGGPMRILEVGCGTGSNLSLLSQFGSVEAIEPDEGARRVAIERSGLSIRGGLLPEDVMLEDGAYDAIVMLDVLEHIPDDFGTLAVLRRKLRPGGRILITVPACPWMWSAHDAAHHHQRRYTLAALKDVACRAGFVSRHHAHFNTLLFPLIAAARAAGKLLGREGGDDAMPARPVNWMLEKLFGWERHWTPRLRVPVGVSLAMVLEPAPSA
jgi:SAM-dependent methyltransferase